MFRRHRIPAAAFLAAVALALVAAAAAALDIGHVSRTYVDPERDDRQIPTEVYYPALQAGEGVPAAPPPPGGFPPLACGHGYLMPWSVYGWIWEDLVTAGYVVALPRTGGELFPDHEDFGLDLAFVLRALQVEAATPASPLYGAVAAAGGVMGHSMGGGAAVLAAASDPDIAALVGFAAAETNPSAAAAAASVTAPSLQFSGSHDCVAPAEQHQLPIHENLASDCRAWANLLGGSHCQFAAYNFTCSLGESGCPSPTLTRTEQQAIAMLLLRPWLDRVLKGDAAAWQTFTARLDSLPEVDYLLDCGPTAAPAGPAGSPLVLMSAPNPCRGGARLRYSLAGAARVEASLFDVAGRRLRAFPVREATAGVHTLAWDGRDGAGRRLSAGVYLLRLRAGEATLSHRLVLLH
ncbi:MAG: T9SS type A sorting domain-containing protein [Candidatus Krumholzibacteriota bacterium]|nr:T9SS type A sorting domain-containing protein [Candidatus Krumholzibacteriota bacterium]